MIVSFRNKLELTPANNGHRFELTSPFIIYIRIKAKIYNVEIPQGFWTDFASIPKALQNILSPLDNHLRAAVLHDYLYYKQKIDIYDITRKHADMIFLDAMNTCGTGKIKRYTMYYAVRSFGWITWNKYKNDRIKKGVKNEN
jgi:hypothetical protein